MGVEEPERGLQDPVPGRAGRCAVGRHRYSLDVLAAGRFYRQLRLLLPSEPLARPPAHPDEYPRPRPRYGDADTPADAPRGGAARRAGHLPRQRG
ncbi:Protein of unknown function [Micromonospora lupini str. Lupac 08]|uniref:Uncharacterized protein n=1 Tax=Micromonospora lupini str. Lupac 08 TaxID=1150864 RepID=I0LCP6_9ACTN|nr:Protein of unknown function [Micromonospora lupini str. Lupac 08]